MDYVGQPLADVILHLQQEKIKFTVDYTIPPNKGYFKVDPELLYVIREKRTVDGTLRLMAAAMMRKEV